ncbi:MAG TPA: NifB/NifX family molybdenum-iron cluster-binding protein [Methanobacterium sp.]|nr:NifB/NifX family molybdenum-iron cluster-binding protein [Methanobacterium sp.]
MKIAVGSKGYNLNSEISDIFGRSSAFLIANIENKEIKEISVINNAQNKLGSGNIAAQIIVDHEVNTVICGKLGPVAFHILKNADIKVFKIIPGSVGKNLKRFREGKLEEITSLSNGFPQ